MSNELNQNEQNDMSDEQVLQYTQAKRKIFVEALMVDNKLPEETGEKMALLTALSGMDKVSLTRMKIKSDEKQSDNTSQLNSLMSRFLTMIEPNKVRNYDDNIKPPTLDNTLEEIKVVEGEVDVGTQSEDYETFQKKLGHQ